MSTGKKDRPRPLTACNNCRQAKTRCEGPIPCKRCVASNLSSTCQRCPPKKRGRKSKSARRAESMDSSSVDRNRAAKRKSSRRRRPTAKRRDVDYGFDTSMDSSPNGSDSSGAVGFVWPAPGVNTGSATSSSAPSPMSSTPSLRQQQSMFHSSPFDQQATMRMLFLRKSMHTWRNTLRTSAQLETSDMDRFAYFVRAILSDVKLFKATHETSPYAQSMQSLSMCDLLVREIEALGIDLGPLPAVDPLKQMHVALRVERFAYRTSPLGVVSLFVYPLPFSTSSHPWVNPQLCDMLSYKDQQLRLYFQSADLTQQLFHPNSLRLFLGYFWEAVANRDVSWTAKFTLMKQGAKAVDVLCSHKLTYCKHNPALPMQLTMFIQRISTPAESMSSPPQVVVRKYEAHKQQHRQESPLAHTLHRGGFPSGMTKQRPLEQIPPALQSSLSAMMPSPPSFSSAQLPTSSFSSLPASFRGMTGSSLL